MKFIPAYYVYIVKCKDGSFYTGQTSDLEKRIKEHNGLLSGGASYTKLKGPVELVHFETYETRSLALKREAEIKKMDHYEKEIVISYPDRPDDV